MLTKKEIKDIQSLYQKKQRDNERLFVAEGPKLAEEIINSQLEIKMIYATASWQAANVDSARYPVTPITDIELQRISHLQTPNQVIVVTKQPKPPEKFTYEKQLTVLLDGIQDPGNMGTIIRTADWFGVSQIICSGDCVDIYNPKVIQASMGSIVRIQCWYEDLYQWQPPENIPVYGAMLQGKNVYTIAPILQGILVIGNESKGIREALAPWVTHPITIPKFGEAESLNAAVAAGIIIGQMVNKGLQR